MGWTRDVVAAARELRDARNSAPSGAAWAGSVRHAEWANDVIKAQSDLVGAILGKGYGPPADDNSADNDTYGDDAGESQDNGQDESAGV